MTGAAAQGLPLPAEFPPSSYTGTQYVDSKGCAFVRAGIGGAVNWVPRVNRAREQLCNFQPTGAAPTASAAAIPEALPNVPIITIGAAPAPVAPRDLGAAPRVAAARPRPAPVVTLPTTGSPVVTSTPRVVPSPVAPPPRRITLAEACAGRTGIQRGFISATTRQPIDCGGAPRLALDTRQSGTGTAAAGPVPQRLTLASACAQQAATGRTLINTATRRPIVCAAPLAVASAPQGRVARPLAQIASACGIDGLISDGRYPVRCGPQALSPSGGGQVARATLAPRSAKPLFGAGPVPASNPQVAVAQPAVPRGYARVWDDGRINPQRGVQTPVAVRVSTRSVAPVGVQAPAATAGHRYVQVGSFGDPANAARLIARLQAAGLPVASARSGSLKVIAAGPFRSATDLDQALRIVRGMGFADAYPRS